MIRAAVSRRTVLFSLQRKVQRVLDHTAAEGKRNALALTGGTTSTRQLIRLGHPFGRGGNPHGGRGAIRGSLPRLAINRQQDGGLQDSLFVLPHASGVGQGYKIGFASPHQTVLKPGGTAVMVARGFWPEWGERTFKAMKQAMRSEFGK